MCHLAPEFAEFPKHMRRLQDENPKFKERRARAASTRPASPWGWWNLGRNSGSFL